MGRFGTVYGGWYIPENHKLGPESFIVSAGVGEDISFDLALQSHFHCTVLLIDPTQRAIQHVEEIRTFYETGRSVFTGSIQPDYLEQIGKLKPDLPKIEFLPVGLWDSKTTLKFYKQDNPSYVSQSLLPDMYTTEYTTVPVERLSSILKGKTPDLVKLDIEGAEITVLESMLTDGILPRILCVEFDYWIKGRDTEQKTLKIIDALSKKGYSIVQNDKMNITFVRKTKSERK